MSTTVIGAEMASWADMQIDLYSKIRSGNLSANQLEWWLNQPKDARDTLMKGEKLVVKEAPLSEPTKKFTLLINLGILTVPRDYDHATALATFRQRNYRKFYGYNDDITDEHFSNPTRVLKPGDRFRVRAFRPVVDGTTTSKEQMDFLRSQKAVFTGAQGASLVFEQKRDQLPKGRWYASFDKKKRLWQDAGGCRRVPFVDASSDDGFYFCLGSFETVYDSDDAFLCFSDLEPESSVAYPPDPPSGVSGG